MGLAIRSARHRQAMLGFYGLVGLAAVTLGVLGTGIYQDWRTLGDGLTSSWFCLAFFRSHRWHLAVLVVLVTVLLAAIWRGGGSLWRQYRASRRLAGQAAALQVPIPEDLREVLRRRGRLGRVTLAGDALYKMLRQGREAAADVPLAGVLGAADLRITQLLSAPAQVRFPLAPGRQVAMTLIALMALLASFTTGCA